MLANGYVHALVDGNLTLKQWTLQCARAFGALISMRDDPMDTPIPEEIKPDSYYKESLDKAQARLALSVSMTDEELLAEETSYCKDSLKSLRKGYKEGKKQLAILKSMREQVEAWTPPEECTNLKEYMLKSLDEADASTDFYDKEIAKLKSRLKNPKPASELRAEKNAAAVKDIVYYGDQYDKQVKRCAEATAWIKALINSLT